MNKLIATLACAAALAASTPVLAAEGGSCHFHGNKPAQEATVVGCAVQRKDLLTNGGKIDASWKAVTHDKVEQVDGKKGKEWKVTFRNPAEKDKEKQALYVFLTMPGNVIAANFTGR